VIPARFRRSALLGRLHGSNAGAVAARRTVEGIGALLGAAGSLALLAVGVVVLSTVAVFILSAVGTLFVMLVAGFWMLMLAPAILQTACLFLVPVLSVVVVLMRRRYRNRMPPAGKGPLLR
jgi:hypothetical protein